jgi:hypothetical protein
LQSNAEVRNWVREERLDIGNIQAYHTGKMVELAAAAGKLALLWQEAADNDLSLKELPNSTVIHVWKWDNNLGKLPETSLSSAQSAQRRLLERPLFTADVVPLSLDGQKNSAGETISQTVSELYWQSELGRVTKTHRAILSAPFYLDHAQPSEQQWEQYWRVDITNFRGSDEQKERVLGGEACIWGELVDQSNALVKTWPLAAAVAEPLWTASMSGDADEARERLVEIRCRMLRRGISAAPIGPGYCP